MGQRTQLVVEVTKREHKLKEVGYCNKKYLGSYHNQWGIGKMQLLDVMRFLTTYVDSCEKYTLPDRLNKGWLMNDEYVFKGKVTPERVMKWMNTKQDNNNGGMLLKVKMDVYGYIKSGELYIFNDPETEYCRYTDTHPDEDIDWGKFKVERVISFVEYMNYYPQYFSGSENEAFVSAFLSLLKFYNIKIMEPEQTKRIEPKEKTNV